MNSGLILTLLQLADKEFDSITLYLDDLLVIRSTLDSNVLVRDGCIDLGEDFWRTRLVAACRLLLQTSGPTFFESQHLLALIGAYGNEADVSKSDLAISGIDLCKELDLLPRDDNELIDGQFQRPKRSAAEISVIAFYLPQFYPFQENDRWWGEGFTEWANVVDAKPQAGGHKMPLLPSDLGFYDLRVKDTRRRQARLAAQYGVDGFCYYYYWFSGRRLMQEVLNEILISGEPSTPFCLCWANESWSRRWDGSEGKVDLLIGQAHNVEADKALFADLLPFFMDERYIKIDGAPLLLIYRLEILDDPAALIHQWRKEAYKAGFPGIFIAAVRSFGLTDAAAEAADAIVDFPPHTAVSAEITDTIPVGKTFAGKVFDYRQVVVEATTRKPGTKMTFPGIMPRWDNTARKAEKSHIFWNSSPNAFTIWASLAFQQAKLLPLAHRFLFVNSWNEWGEGAMLEPDRHYGRSYLEALRRARGSYAVGPSDIAKFALVSNLPPAGAEDYLRNFSKEVQMVSQIMAAQRSLSNDAFRTGMPGLVTLSEGQPIVRDGQLIFDHSFPEAINNCITVQFGQPLSLVGWMIMEIVSHPYSWDRVAYLVLVSGNINSDTYHTPITRWRQRADINMHYGLDLKDDEVYFGFDLNVSTDLLAAGTYSLSGIQAIDGRVLKATCYVTICKADL